MWSHFRAEQTSRAAADVCDLCVSDHFLVMFSLPFVKPQLQFVKRTRRRWADFDIVKFEDELAATELMTTDSTDVNFLFQLYDTTLRSLLDKHAPERTVNRRLRPQTPWYDTDLIWSQRQCVKMASELFAWSYVFRSY